MAIVRLNQNIFESGEEFSNRLLIESTREFQILLFLLSSYFTSKIDGPNYARELKAMAIALAHIRLDLGDIQNDTYYATTREEYMYQVITSVVFPQRSGPPDLQRSDVEFRDFLQAIIAIYFKGSIPDSIEKAVELITGGTVIIRENYLEARKPGSGFDISDEFGFTVDVFLQNPGSLNTFLADKNIRILLDIIRPAHTLYKVGYILQDNYIGQKDNPAQLSMSPSKVMDSFTFNLSNYGYEDFRKFVEGVKRIDPLGTKMAVDVVGEDHSMDF